ncbi:kinase-like domain-containing protein [Mycena vitilis]|nr:kinase-like domain-containing protein [Mycena vitilis]
MEEHTWIMMMLAGDCCVRVSGRLFSWGKPAGFCMPVETPIESAEIATREERMQLIKQVHDLVTELHSKNIVHGDVKPQNLLMCSDGRMRLCDFDNASLEGDGFSITDLTLPYCSQFRSRHPQVPMTRAEDTYALGLTIWELYTGRTPLLYGDETLDEGGEWLEQRVNVGMGPEMQVIDDPHIYALIETCLAAGPDCPDEYCPDMKYCVQNQVELGDCRAQPRHLYSRIVHARFCGRSLDNPGGPCEYPYASKKVISLSVPCMKCTPGIDRKPNDDLETSDVRDEKSFPGFGLVVQPAT